MTTWKPQWLNTGWRRKAFLVVAVPLVVAVGCFAYLALVQFRSAQRVTIEMERIRSALLPTDAESQHNWFVQRTSREHSDAWAEILFVAEWMPTKPSLREPEKDSSTPSATATIVPSESQDNELAVADWFDTAQPLLAQIHQVSRSSAATWQPLAFDGIATLLRPIQSSRTVAAVLEVEIEHALEVGDSDRAMQAIESLNGLAQAFDWRICLVSELVTLDLRQMKYRVIQRSLGVDIWRPEQLEQLTKLLEPEQDFPRRWRDVIAAERAFILHELSHHGGHRLVSLSTATGFAAIFLLPTVKERLLLSYAEIETLADQGIEHLLEHAEQWEQFARLYSRDGGLDHRALAMIMPATAAAAQWYVRHEDARRLTRTAVAIKQYKIANGSFPSRLTQLESIGLNAADWTIVQGTPFAYEVDGPAYLWSYPDGSLAVGRTIAASRPSPDDSNKTPTVTIR